MSKLTPLSKFLITIVIVGGLGFLIYSLANNKSITEKILPKGNSGGSTSNIDRDKVIRVGVVTWGGYAGGEYFNEGFKPSKESRYTKEYDINVEFILNDDFNSSREAWKAGEVDVLWTTMDAFPTEVDGFKELEPQVIFQSDWSRGGDAIVVRRGIETVADLKGKTVAVAPMTPSNTFLIWLLDAGGLKKEDIKIIEAPNAVDAAQYFKAKKVDAAVVWSPDDEDCVQSVSGSKILRSTKAASNIIADVFFVKKSYLEKNKEGLRKLVEGWMRGAAEINASETNRRKAAKILADGLGQPEEFCYNAIQNARLCTYGDNANFFNIDGTYKGVKGEDLYNRMSKAYYSWGYAPAVVPAFRFVTNSSLIKEIKLSGSEHEAEGASEFTPVTKELKTAPAFSTKGITITFPTGSYTLDENAKYIIDMEFTEIAKAFGNARVRIEGNTDNVGSEASNLALSERRAQAVADYLEKEHHLPRNKFVIVGNGSKNPIADNSTDKGRSKNRRTDFQLLAED
jgi:NitT/TauT family transport system substrate-binding protein